MDLVEQRNHAVKAYLDRLRGGLPWHVEPHRTDATRGHVINKFGANVATDLSRGVAEFIVEAVNRDPK